ncbi:hypothetical protein [Paraliobacillus sp. PM-2]|uniref:hypothetical protein n=1 Tax=Paraliobacillus sp. PM-2 TaxID=1462524 RepID=UPI001146ADCC|nr:hypothetical protein [Paraliobacillus sp. PM-2]
MSFISGKAFTQEIIGDRTTSMIVITSQTGDEQTYTFTFEKSVDIPERSLIAPLHDGFNK